MVLGKKVAIFWNGAEIRPLEMGRNPLHQISFRVVTMASLSLLTGSDSN